MKKRCYKCKEEKPLNEFSLDSSRKDGHTNRCKSCKKNYSKSHYVTNIEKFKSSHKEWKSNNSHKINEYNTKQSEKRTQLKMKAIEYKGGKCTDCGISAHIDNRVIFDFHHKNPTDKEISLSSSSMIGLEWDKICEELEKCELLCSNCHKLRHDHYKRGLRDTL